MVNSILYEQWLRIALEKRNDRALLESGSGKCWTFGQLHAAQQELPAKSGPFFYPQGHSAQFITTVLAAWRAGGVVCPLESGAAAPMIADPPKGCIHLKSTSATTGAARMAAFTATQLAADARNIVSTMGLSCGEPNLGVISLAHSYGFSNLVLPLLLHGIPLILVESPLPESLRKATLGEKSLVLPAVPTMWSAWEQADSIPKNIRLAISAGAPLPLSVERDVFKTRGLKIHNFYGSTECGGIAFDASQTPREDDTLVGSPMQNVSLSVNDDGCMQVQGDAVGQTYWPDSEETLRPGCFQTSDLVELRDGLVYMRGRLSDVINVAGRKLSPASVEKTLLTHPAVKDCLVFGIPDALETRTELPVACVVTSSPTSPEELRQFLLSHLPAWQIPRQWRFVADLQRNKLGKVSRATWRTRFSTPVN